MREILFKAKTESGRWIEGDLIHYQSGEVAIIEKPFSKYGHEATEICGRTLVLPDTICQYTGLTDKNGNMIWENDIVFVTDGDGCSGITDTGVGEIDFLLGLWYVSGSIQNSLYDVLEVIGHEAEVIGNIFDNPELLERN